MKYPLKQLFLTPIVSLISLVIFFGCATYHTCPKLSDVPPGDSMPIDGVWKNCNGVLFRIERGRAYTTCELSSGLPANRVFIRDIRRISAGHYIGMEETYNSKKRLSAFGPNQIDIVSANRIRITTKPNPTTGYKGGEAFLEVHSLDDEQSYLLEFIEMANTDPNQVALVATRLTDESIELLNRTIESNPNTNLYYARGIIWRQRGDQEKAIKDFTKALDLNPKFVEAYYYRGLSWREKDDQEKAIKDFTKALDLNPKFVEAYYYRGLSWREKDDQEKALEDLFKTIEMKPRSTFAKDAEKILKKLPLKSYYIQPYNFGGPVVKANLGKALQKPKKIETLYLAPSNIVFTNDPKIIKVYQQALNKGDSFVAFARSCLNKNGLLEKENQPNLIIKITNTGKFVMNDIYYAVSCELQVGSWYLQIEKPYKKRYSISNREDIENGVCQDRCRL